MSRRRRPAARIVPLDPGHWLIKFDILRPVEAARRERVQRQVARVKRRAAKRWPT